MVLNGQTEILLRAVRDEIGDRIAKIHPDVHNYVPASAVTVDPAPVVVNVDMTPVADAIDRMTAQLLANDERMSQLLVVLSEMPAPVVNVAAAEVVVPLQRAPVVKVYPPDLTVSAPTVNVESDSARRPVAFRLDVDGKGVKRMVPEY